jgi:glycosyltransferase involved in cell wall biosynthesis
MNPKVSVFMVTYNHEKFIAQAIESVLMQQTDFDYELVIGEDCSTDGTREIVKKYADQNPGRIKALFRPHNLGIRGPDSNGVLTLKECNGRYIAMLEGDDYWTDTLKLQKQADFLDAHPECAICFHNSEEFYDDGGRQSWLYCSEDQKEISTLEDLLSKCNFIPSCSAMYRNGLFGDFPDWYYTLGMGDWTLHLLNAQYGDIGYINEVMGRHRHHAGGVWSLRNQAQNIMDVINAYKTINRYFNYRYNSIITVKISDYYYDLFSIYINSGEKATAFKNLYYSFSASPFTKKLSTKYLASLVNLLVSIFYKSANRT